MNIAYNLLNGPRLILTDPVNTVYTTSGTILARAFKYSPSDVLDIDTFRTLRLTSRSICTNLHTQLHEAGDFGKYGGFAVFFNFADDIEVLKVKLDFAKSNEIITICSINADNLNTFLSIISSQDYLNHFMQIDQVSINISRMTIEDIIAIHKFDFQKKHLSLVLVCDLSFPVVNKISIIPSILECINEIRIIGDLFFKIEKYEPVVDSEKDEDYRPQEYSLNVFVGLPENESSIKGLFLLRNYDLNIAILEVHAKKKNIENQFRINFREKISYNLLSHFQLKTQHIVISSFDPESKTSLFSTDLKEENLQFSASKEKQLKTVSFANLPEKPPEREHLKKCCSSIRQPCGDYAWLFEDGK